MLNIEPVKKITVTEQIMERIAQMITDGELVSGEQLPNERMLAEQFGVARGRIREALRALSLVGLVTIKAGEGSFVSSRKQPIPRDTITWLFRHEVHNLDEIYDARRLIESAVYVSAARLADEDQLAGLDEILAEFETAGGGKKNKKVQKGLVPAQFATLLNQLDLYVGEICGNQIYTKLMQTIVHLREDMMEKLLSVPGALERSVESRTRIIHALKSKDTGMVEAELKHFYDSSREFYGGMLGE